MDKYNSYDRIEIDLTKIRERVEEESTLADFKENKVAIVNFFRLFIVVLLRRLGIQKRLVWSGFILGWFLPFENFWRNILQGRPIDVTDFHYLRACYRSKFQSVSVEDEYTEEGFLRGWQSRGTAYLLFGAVWTHAKADNLMFLRSLSHIPKKGRILEYGCGIAPITNGLRSFLGHRKYDYTLLDIDQINFYYAIYRHKKHASYRVLPPMNNLLTSEDGNFDVIYCLTVLEHVPNPDEVVQSFERSLNPNGLLIFDFIMGEGHGLDSVESSKKRVDTLDYIRANFTLVSGEIDHTNHVGFTICRKNI